MQDRERAVRWGLIGGLALALAGYLGAWISHPTVGLTIQGRDLAEYVKFLPEVRAGAISTWREWFILPAAALALGMTLAAASRRLAVRWYVAAALLLCGSISALTLLPPAWTPALLLTPEFRLQTGLLGVCAAALLLAPALRRLRLPGGGVALAALGLAGAVSMAGALRQFVLLKPAIDLVYGGSAHVGWGVFAFAAGGILFIGACAYGVTASGRRPRG